MIPSIVAVIECLRDVYEAANRHTNQEEAKALTAGLHSVSRVGQEIQTIAINAAIEDARAGPAGRGFAIISQETRGLSKTSETSLEALNALLGRDSAA
jgi:methyl-accepting chemotaxis protein